MTLLEDLKKVRDEHPDLFEALAKEDITLLKEKKRNDK